MSFAFAETTSSITLVVVDWPKNFAITSNQHFIFSPYRSTRCCFSSESEWVHSMVKWHFCIIMSLLIFITLFRGNFQRFSISNIMNKKERKRATRLNIFNTTRIIIRLIAIRVFAVALLSFCTLLTMGIVLWIILVMKVYVPTSFETNFHIIAKHWSRRETDYSIENKIFFNKPGVSSSTNSISADTSKIHCDAKF